MANQDHQPNIEKLQDEEFSEMQTSGQTNGLRGTHVQQQVCKCNGSINATIDLHDYVQFLIGPPSFDTSHGLGHNISVTTSGMAE